MQNQTASMLTVVPTDLSTIIKKIENDRKFNFWEKVEFLRDSLIRAILEQTCISDRELLVWALFNPNKDSIEYTRLTVYNEVIMMNNHIPFLRSEYAHSTYDKNEKSVELYIER